MTEVVAITPGKDGSSAGQSNATYSIKNVSQESLVLATTIVIFLLCAIFIRGFLTLANISTLVRSVSVLGILGVGMTVVVIGRGLDLSQVAVLAICAAWSLKLIGLGFGLAAGLALGLGFAIAIGIFNGFAISIVGIPALFTTLASGTLVYGIGRWLMLNGIITYTPDNQPQLLAIGQGELLGVPIPLLIFGVVANCQTLVSLTLARGEVPVMVALRLFVPESWTSNPVRLKRAGVPVEHRAARTKPEIALAEIDRVIASGCVSAVCLPIRVRLQRAFPPGFERARSAVGVGSVAAPERLSRRHCPDLPHREDRKAPQIPYP